ncbi:hypothetical protein PPTG_04082 [Phytophthora nicotianae INRA-310]|uniref:Uncharacterized protein n=1 Tax=Phytophthora nicotianae (strain INRA-310) TaxID=761204 RepID=W2QZT1_PHYN3|nr:hypothetical protein PPTG_04082 [Phytophthora nicotianae INRA-310]ETN18491.1 hypothetical protein PPTG_04082 [Phytophthora nicotianae INRA-310]
MGKNFVVADISNNINHVYFYDERAQGKDADALCRLRLNYHLAKLLGNLHSNLPPAEASIDSVRLSRHEVKILPAKKQKSLAAKYFFIPPVF